MTRRMVYGIGFWSFLAVIGMTLAAIIIPEWLVYKPDTGLTATPHHTYGLHSRCTTLSTHTTCHPFPRTSDCHSPTTSRHFCTLWRTTGFLVSLAVVFQLATVITFVICLSSGKQKRVMGWKMLCGLLSVSVVTKLAAVVMVGHMGMSEERFAEDWYVGRSWVLVVVSCAVELGIVALTAGSRFFLEEEGGYELIPEVPRYRR